MPDAPVPVFRENKAAALVFLILGAMCLFLGRPPMVSGWTFTGAALIAVGVAWLLPVTLELRPDRISYRSAFRVREMRLDALERFYYKAVSVRLYGIALGTRYSFKLVDHGGQTISLGMRMRKPRDLGEKLVEYTSLHLARKCARSFDSGREVDFGYIRLSRSAGLQVKKPAFRGLWRRIDRIPLDQVSQFGFRRGRVLIWRKGEKQTTGPLIHKVPNAFVLVGLLETLCPDALSGSGAPVRPEPGA